MAGHIKGQHQVAVVRLPELDLTVVCSDDVSAVLRKAGRIDSAGRTIYSRRRGGGVDSPGAHSAISMCRQQALSVGREDGREYRAAARHIPAHQFPRLDVPDANGTVE